MTRTTGSIGIGQGSREFAGAGFGEVVAVEALTEQGLDDGLAADVEFFGGGVQLAQHGGGEVHIHALDGRHPFLFWRLPRRIFESQPVVEQVGAASSFFRTPVITADLHKFFRSQPFMHHSGYVLKDIEAAALTISIGALDNPICHRMLTSVGTCWRRAGIGVAHPYSFLPRFN